MIQPHPDRQRLERYFRYPTMIVRPGWAWILSILQAGAVFATLFVKLRENLPLTPENVGETLLEAVIFSACVFALGSVFKFLILQLHKTISRQRRKTALASLEHDVLAILKYDYERAMKQMVRKAGIRNASLREIGTPHHDPLESQLFSPAELRKFMGLLTDQSIRMLTPYGPEPDFSGSAADRLLGRGLFKAYYQPVRFICLFFTNSEIIVADSVFDSRTGDLSTQIKRLPEASISSLQTTSSETRHSIPPDRLRDWLDQHQFTPDEEKSIAVALERHEKALKSARGRHKQKPDSPYVLLRTAKYLLLNRTKGKALTLPMSFSFELVRGKGMKLRPPENTPFPLAAHAQAERSTPPETLSQPLRERVSYLEYRTRWTLIADLVTALLAAGICMAVLSVVTEAPVRTFVSGDFNDVQVERNGIPGPRTPKKQTPAPQSTHTDLPPEDAKLVCLKLATTLKEDPSWKGRSLTTLRPGQSAYLVDVFGGPQLPDGWSKIEIRSEANPQTGYVTTSVLQDPIAIGSLTCSDQPD